MKDEAGLIERIKSFSGSRILLVTHRNADLDALASLALAKLLFEGLRPGLDVDIFIPGKISGKASPFLPLLDLQSLGEEDLLPSYDLLVFLDVGGVGVLPTSNHLLKAGSERWLIDHHLPKESFLSHFDFKIIDYEDSSSTCEILYKTCLEAGIGPPRDLLKALLAGILVEAGFLRIAKCGTFPVVEDLCRRGVNIKSILPLLKREKDLSERVALLKALKRMDLYRSGDWIITLTRLGAYHSEASRILATLGVDLAVVGDDLEKQGKRCKIHMRISHRFLDDFNLTAGGDLVKLLIEEFGGEGGGHSTVAVLELEAPLEAVYRFLKAYVEEELVKVTGKRLLKME